MNTPRSSSPRWRGQHGASRTGCLILLGVVIVGLAIPQIMSCLMMPQLEVETRQAEERRAEEERAKEAARKAAESKAELESFVTSFVGQAHPAQLTQQPYIRGKAVVLSNGDPSSGGGAGKEFKRESYGLGDGGDAQSLAELGTVVLLNYKTVSVGAYVERATGYTTTGYRIDCDVTIFDRDLGAVIYKKTYRGKEPAGRVSVRVGSQVLGASPSSDIRSFIKSLPRQ